MSIASVLPLLHPPAARLRAAALLLSLCSVLPHVARAEEDGAPEVLACDPEEWVLLSAVAAELDEEPHAGTSPCAQEDGEPHALARITSTAPGPLPTGAFRPAEGAQLEARLSTPWLSGHLDAVLSAQDGGRLEARGMGLQLRLSERRDELRLGRYVSRGAGLRPDLPLIGMRYSSRASTPSVPQPAPRVPAVASRRIELPPGALGHRIALPSVVSDEPLGTLEVRLRELRKADEPPGGPGVQLLPRGVSDVSFEAGLLARDAQTFQSTGIPAATLSVRHGWRTGQTLSARAVQAGDSLLLAGLSEFRWQGLTTAGATLRERGLGSEPGWLLRHDYQAWGFTGRLRLEGLASSAKAGGSGLLGTPHRRNSELALSWAPSPLRAITLSAGERLKLDGGQAELLSLSGSLRSGSGSLLAVGLKHAVDHVESTQFTIDWRIPLESRKPSRRSGRGWGGFGGLLR